MLLRRLFSWFFVVVPLFYCGDVYAGKYDLQLSRFWSRNTGMMRDGARRDLELLMGDMAATLAPRFIGSGRTLGSYGFSLAFDYSFTDINENSRRWQTVMTDPNLAANQQDQQVGADSALRSYQLHLRKGLPYSMELGAALTRLDQSRLWGVNFEFKFAPIEGLKGLPDIGMRTTFTTALNTNDYTMYAVSEDVVLSKRFGLFGLFSLAPYLGYQFQLVYAGSNVITYFDNNKFTLDKGQRIYEPQQGTFAAVYTMNHYGTLGIRLLAMAFDVGFETAMTKENTIYSFRGGLDF